MIVPQTTCSPTRQCWLRAWNRAVAEQLIPYRLDAATWEVKTYTLTVTGAGWSDLTCNCAAGRNGRICKHAAVVAAAISRGVRLVRGTEKGKDVGTAPAFVPHASVLVAGVAPSMTDMYA